MNGGTSASDLLKALNARKPPSSGIDVSRMLNPLGGPGLSNKDIMGSISDSLTMPKVERIPMKLNPSTGRSVTIGAGIDVGRGFRLMEQSCARNKVRSDATKQRFHERGGLKRKRLRRERWRRKFLEGFKATVGRVKQLKNQGW
jgi:small subunit ribosomal protein MRP21